MSERTPTPAQQKALDLSRPVAVAAGAGSGKTFVLTERYLRALEHVRGRPVPLRRVVALTFTEKATLEMRARVRTGVRARIQHARRLGDRDRAAFWRGVLQDLHLARITTFHGFCTGLLRELPLEAGVDPAVEVVDAPTVELLTQESVRTYLSEVSRRTEGGDRERGALASLLRHYRSREIRLMLERLLVEREFADDWMDATPPRVSETLEAIGRKVQGRLATSAAAIRARVGDDALRTLADPSGAPDGDKLTAMLHAIAPFARALADDRVTGQDVEAARTELITSSKTPRKAGRLGAKKFWGAGPALATARDAVGDLALALHEELDWYVPFRLAREQIGVEADISLRILGRGIRDHFLDRLGRGRRLDFAGLELEARRLLARPGVALRLRRELDFLLVDEFQDTNGVQWSLLRAILDAGNPDDPDDATPNLFVVGDDKQAIYEFRGGRVEVFREAAAWIVRNGGREVSLDDNFRTLPRPIAVVNHLFDGLFRGSAERPFEPRAQALVPHRDALDGGDVTVLLTPKDVGWEGEADRVADHVMGLVENGAEVVDPDTGDPRPIRYEDVAVVVPYRRDFQYLEDAFAARGVLVNVLGGLGFFQTPEVSDALSLLQALTDPVNDLALAAVLRSPLANLSDPGLLWLATREERRLRDRLDAAVLELGPAADLSAADVAALRGASAALARWGRMRGRVPTTTLLERAWDETGYRAVLAGRAGGANRLANLDKLLEIVSAYEARHGIRTAGLVEWLETQSRDVVDEAEATEFAREPGVTVMTIHKSKGTEYPLVVVAGLADRGIVSDTGPIALHHGIDATELALRVPVMRDDDDRASDRLAPSMAFKLLRDHLEDRSDAEAKRVLYVALTRARDRLVLSGQVSARPPVRRTAFSWLAEDPVVGDALTTSEDATIELGGVPVTVLAPREVGRPDAERADALLGVIDALPVSSDARTPGAGPATPSAAATENGHAPAMIPSPPSIAVTRLAQVAAAPRDAFARDVLGLDDAESLDDDHAAAEVDAADGGDVADAASVDLAVDDAPPLDRHAATASGEHTGPDLDPREAAARLGRAVHAALAGATTPGAPIPGVPAHVAAFGRSPHGAEALAAPTSRAEVTFLLPLHPSGRPRLEGTLDRLYQDPQGVWTIVDAKTSRPRRDESLDAHARRHGYDVQLRLYAAAVRVLQNLPDEAMIHAVLVFTHPSLPDDGREWVRTWTAGELPRPEALARMAGDLARAGMAPDAGAFAEAVSSVAELARP